MVFHMPLANIEHGFVNSLLRPDANESEFLSELQPSGSLTKERQLAIYRSNINGAYQKVLGQVYPACLTILGEDYFNQLCRAYRFEYPSRKPDLNIYGKHFPSFLEKQIDKHKELAGFEYLVDLALLEWHWHASYFCKEDNVFDFEGLALVEEEKQARLVLTLSHSFSLHSSEYPILDIWQANRNEPDDNQQFPMPEAELYFCINRDNYEPIVEILTTNQFLILNEIKSGITLLKLTEQYKIDLQNQVMSFISKGWITGFIFQE